MKSFAFLVLLGLLAIKARADELDDEIFDDTAAEFPDGCTSIGIGRLATEDHSTYATHTADCKNCDYRLFRVPRRTNLGKKRPIYETTLTYPRFVGDFRGKDNYKKRDKDTINRIIGYIPETTNNYTYSYYDGVYGIMNEMGVGIGESTCGSKIWAAGVGAGGKALLNIDSLTRIALERTTTAHEAVKLMAQLAYDYGFFGAEAVTGEGGEALTVTDSHGEVWVFQVTAGDWEGKNGVAVAQRVPDDHISVVPNTFTIGEVDCDDDKNFVCTPNLISAAKALGFYNPEKDGKFDFVKAFDPPNMIGFKYASRRSWRIYSLAAPSLGLQPKLERMPFSVKVDKPLTLTQVRNFNRDYYEGTEFDLTKGLAAGPFGTPNRYENDPRVKLWERAISLYRTTYSTVLQGRSWLPPQVGSVMWFSMDAPHSSAYQPFYAGGESVPEAWHTGSLERYDPKSAWWKFDFVSNWADLKFKFMIQDIRKEQEKVEGRAHDRLTKTDLKLKSLIEDGKEKEAKDLMTKTGEELSEQLLSDWDELTVYLITKYNDGYCNVPNLGGDEAGYPTEWVKLTHRADVELTNKPEVPPPMFTSESGIHLGVMSSLMAASALLAVGVVGGIFVANRQRRSAYTTLA